MNFNKLFAATECILKFKTAILFFSAALFSISAQATVGLTLQGKILKTDNTAVNSSNVQFRIQVRSPGTENCLLYEETQTLNMSDSNGLFVLTVGTGARPSILIDGGYSLAQAFTNKGTLDLSATAPAACAVGTDYTPASTDHRKLVYYFNDGSGWQTVSSMNITWTPFSIETLKVGGFQSTDLLRVVDGSGNPATAPSLTSVQATELMSLIAGSSAQYITPSAATFTAAPKYNGAVSASSDLTNKYYVDTTISTAVSNAISGSISLPNTGTAGTYLKVTTDAQGRVTSGDATLTEADIPTLTTPGKVSGNAITSGTISGSTSINTSGNLVTTGTVSALTNQSTNLRIYNGAEYIQFNAPTLAASIAFTLPSADGTSGQVLSTNGSGVLSWATASGGATTLSGDVSGASTATSVDRLKGKNITAASVSGQMMIYDGTQWNNRVVSGDATIDHDGALSLNTVPINKGGTGATTFSGDRLMATNVTGTALEAISCGLNQVISFTAAGAIQCSNVSSLITTSGFTDGGNSFSADATLGTNSNHALKFETNNSVAMTISQDGKIGIGTTDPQSALDLYSSNLGSDGDLTMNMTVGNTAPYSFPPKTGIGFKGRTDATASTVYFSGVSGGKENTTINNTAGYLSFSTQPNGKSPTERIRIESTGNVGIGTATPGTSLDVTGAITSRPYGTATGNTGQILLRELAANGTNTVTLRAPDALAASIAFTLPSADGTSGQVLSTDGAGVLSWTTASGGGSGGDFANGGNTFSADATLGTNSNHGLRFETNNSVAMAISTNGNVGFGTITPTSKLDINGVITMRDLSSPSVSLAGQGTIYYEDMANAFMISANESPYRQLLDTSTGFFNGGNSFSYDATLGTSDNYPLKFKANNSVAMTISNNGNVGIGIGTPTSKLHVVGAVDIQSGASSLTIGANSFSTNRSVGTDKSSNILAVARDNTQVSIIGTDNSNTFNNLNIGGGTTFNAATKIGFFTAGAIGTTTGTERMTINSAGNIGIGTASPGTSLDVSGAITSRPTGTATGNTGQILLRELAANGTHTVTLRAPDALAASIAFTLPSADGTSGQVLSTDGAGVLSWITASGGGGTSGFSDGGDTFSADATLGTNSNHALKFETNNTVAMTISQDGSVGIGTASPSSKLHIQDGAILAAGTTGATPASGAGTRMMWIPNKAAFRAGIVQSTTWDSASIGNYSAGFGQSTTSSGTAAFSSGRATAATGNYSTALGRGGIASGENSTALGYYTTAETYAQTTIGRYNTASTGSASSWVDTEPLFVIGNGTSSADLNSAMTVLKNGSVGIGTASPGTSLDVSGAITSRPTGTATGNTGQILLRELAANGTNTVTLRAPDALAASIAFTLPSADGTSGQVLSTDGAGVLSWITASGGGGTSGFSDGGNTFSADATLGTNSNHALKFETNNTVAMTISQNSRVGIGIASPTAKLEVAGPTGIPGVTITAPDDSEDYLKLKNSSGNTNFLFSSSYDFATMKMYDDSSNEKIGLYTKYNEGPNLYLNPGVDKPDSETDAYGSALFIRTPNVVNEENGIFFSDITFDQAPGAAITFYDTDGAGYSKGGLKFKTSSNTTGPKTRMTITETGLIGIGTTSPGTSLDVSGAITSRPTGTATGNTGQFIMRELAANGTHTVTLRAPDALAASIAFTLPSADGTSGQVLSTDGAGVLSWVTASGGGGTSGFSDGGDAFSADATLGTNSNHALKFETNNTVAMTISQDGSVGIGNSNPNNILTVSKSVDGFATSSLTNSNTGSNAIALNQISNGSASLRMAMGGSNLSSVANYQANWGLIETNASSNGLKLSSTNGPLRLLTGNKDSMTISQDGSVGIGVASPSASLDVSGAVHATGQIYSDAPVSDSGTPTSTVDFNTGNTQVLQNVGSSTITLNNMKDGGSYLVIITDTTSRTYTFSGCTNSKFNPVNASTTSGAATLYNIVKVTISGATHCFISWSSGYQ